MITLMVQKYGQTVVPSDEMIVDGSQVAASQVEDSQQQTAESPVSSDYSDGTEVWTDSAANLYDDYRWQSGGCTPGRRQSTTDS